MARLANHPAFDLPQYGERRRGGRVRRPADACAMGQTIGAYLKEYGFNMDFAPDADVNTNPDNPIIGMRAFSSDAATAAEMAAAAAGRPAHRRHSCRRSSIFPGHGDTAEDSHTALAVTYKRSTSCKPASCCPLRRTPACTPSWSGISPRRM